MKKNFVASRINRCGHAKFCGENFRESCLPRNFPTRYGSSTLAIVRQRRKLLYICMCVCMHACRSLLLVKGLWIMGDLKGNFFACLQKKLLRLTLRVLVRNARFFVNNVTAVQVNT